MIAEKDVIPILLAACPGFQTACQEHLAYWDGKSPGAFLDAAELARHLVQSYDRNDTSEFFAAFAGIEKIFAEGDQEARDLAGFGVIEALQNIASHSCGEEVFVEWLGPTSRLVWAQITKMWEGKNSLMDVIRAER